MAAAAIAPNEAEDLIIKELRDMKGTEYLPHEVKASIRAQWSDFTTDWARQIAAGLSPPAEPKRSVRLPASPMGGRGRSGSSERGKEDPSGGRSGSQTPRRGGGASITPRSRELVSVLKGMPQPDSPFTLDLLNSRIEEEATKRRDDGQRVTVKDFTPEVALQSAIVASRRSTRPDVRQLRPGVAD